MCGYIVEEIDEIPVYYNNSTDEGIDQYWTLYSHKQKKRFIKALNQLKSIWNDVYMTLETIHISTNTDIDNELMPKIYKLFIIIHKSSTEYYTEQNIKKRAKMDYMVKKLNKYKNTIYIL